MQIRTRVVLMATTMGLLAVGCGSGSGSYEPKKAKPVESAMLKQGEEARLWPFRVGNQWTFKTSSEARSAEGVSTTENQVTLRIDKVTPTEDGSAAEFSFLDRDGKTIDRQVWRLGSKGLYQLRAGLKPVAFDPPQPAVLFPVKVGKQFSWKGAGLMPVGQAGPVESKSQILDSQEVDTDQGRVSAIPIETVSTFTFKNVKGAMLSTAYWQPGVGLVRYRQEIIAGTSSATQVWVLMASVVKE